MKQYVCYSIAKLNSKKKEKLRVTKERKFGMVDPSLSKQYGHLFAYTSNCKVIPLNHDSNKFDSCFKV